MMRSPKLRRRCGLWLLRSWTVLGAAGCRAVVVAGLMGSVSVVVVFVGCEDLSCVAFVHDQDVVEEFASECADDAFAVGVHPGRLRCALDHAQVVGLEDGIERLAVLAVAVPEKEAQGLRPVSEVGGEVPGLLCGPCLGRVGGDAGGVQASGVVFEEGQCVQACAEHGVEVEEVGRDDALGLGGEELSPGRAGAACGVPIVGHRA